MKGFPLSSVVATLLVACAAQAQPQQSPIKFPLSLVPEALPTLTFDYKNYPNTDPLQRVKVKNEGSPHPQKSLKAYNFGDLTLKSTVTVAHMPGDPAVTYTLDNFHFHQRAEHALSNQNLPADHFPMELHLVHKNGGANLAIGRWIIVGDENPALNEIFKNAGWPASGGVRTLVDPLPLGQLEPLFKNSYRYHGSLTHPDLPIPNEPVAEPYTSTVSVKWIMLTEPMTMSQEQMDQFASDALDPDCGWPNGNRRIIQELKPEHGLKTDVPEPSAAMLLVVAGIVTGLRRRRSIRGI